MPNGLNTNSILFWSLQPCAELSIFYSLGLSFSSAGALCILKENQRLSRGMVRESVYLSPLLWYPLSKMASLTYFDSAHSHMLFGQKHDIVTDQLTVGVLKHIFFHY
jgi:hypothetical protein